MAERDLVTELASEWMMLADRLPPWRTKDPSNWNKRDALSYYMVKACRFNDAPYVLNHKVDYALQGGLEASLAKRIDGYDRSHLKRFYDHASQVLPEAQTYHFTSIYTDAIVDSFVDSLVASSRVEATAQQTS